MPFYSEEIKTKLNTITPIADLMVDEGERISGKGKTLSFACPMCGGDFENSKIDVSRNFFKCFRCEALYGRDFKGKPVNYLQQRFGYTLPEAIEYLAQRNGMSLPSPGYSSEEKMVKSLFFDAISYYERFQQHSNYLFLRGVSSDVIRKYRVGYALASSGQNGLKRYLLGKGHSEETLLMHQLINNYRHDRFLSRVVVPLFRKKFPVDLYARRIDGVPTLKHLYCKGNFVSFGAESIPVGVPVLDIYESVINKLVAESNGFPYGFSIGGCTKFSHSHLLLIKNINPGVVRIIFDADREGQGQRAAYKVGMLLSRAGIRVEVVLLPLGSDVADVFLMHTGREIFLQCLEKAVDFDEYQVHYLLKGMSTDLIQKHLSVRSSLCSTSPATHLNSLFSLPLGQ